jgi:hypothetical protein
MKKDFKDFKEYFLCREANNLGYSNIKNTYKKIFDIFHNNDIDFYVVGGFALSYYNYHRMTNDIDIVLKFNDYVERLLVMNGFKRCPHREIVPKFLDNENGVEVEILPDGGKVAKVSLSFPKAEDVENDFIDLETLISLKLDSSNHYPALRAKDRSDCVELIRINNLPRDFNVDPIVKNIYTTIWDDIQENMLRL